MIEIEFPIVTSPPAKRDDFLKKFQEIALSDFKHLIAVAPFVDGRLITNLLKGFLYNTRRLTIVTRYGDLFPDQKKLINQTITKLKSAAKKDQTISERVIWRVNPRVHAKFVIKDWQCILFGSHNFTYSALKKNYELSAYIEGISSFKKDLRAFLDNILQHSTKTLFPENRPTPKKKR
jgi:phosphatidylserine/phosphatidylglycerophosphate/cardiolipin synthase-like enzyme